MVKERPVFPFSAIVGQEKLKLALILNVVNPKIGGALLTGTKGSGKSIVVRALADLLPLVDVVAECPFNCNPYDPTNMCENCRNRFEKGEKLPTEKRKMQIVQLPIGATEESVIGTLELEKAFREGIKALQPGILAKANQNILYIDEVNLLPDHLADAILDAAASGWNVIQREEISVMHPSRFVLVGSMNPEEGDLRPQILDRFALHAKAENLYDREKRIEIIERNLSFEDDPVGFRKRYEVKQMQLKEKIETARKFLSKVRVSDAICEAIAQTCISLRVDGHRPDIVAIKAAETLAAFNGRTEVESGDVLVASELALSHRTRLSGLEPPASIDEIRKFLEKALQSSTVLEQLAEMGTSPAVSLPLPERVTVPEIGPIEVAGIPPETLKLPPLKIVHRKIQEIIAMMLSHFILPFLLFLITAFTFLLFFSPPQLPPTVEHPSQLPSLIFGWRGVYAVTIAIVGLSIYLLFLRRKRKEAPSIYYAPFTPEIKGKTARRIISQLYGPVEGVQGAPSYEMVADRGVLLSKAYKTIMGFGQKVASTIHELLELFRERSEFELSLEKPKSRTVKRAKTVTTLQRGRYIWFELPEERPWDIALGPTLRAAAPYQQKRKSTRLTLKIEPQDVRVKMREYRPPNSIVLLLDMSESMAASLDNVREAILSLHKTAYRRRDSVGLVVFKGTEATVLQYPTTNLNLVVRKLLEVGTSDFTPLATGMLKAQEIFRLERHRNKDVVPILVIISDGIANVPLERPLSPFTRQQFSNPSQADALDAAYQIAKDNIRTVIINTDHRPEEIGITREAKLCWYSPTDFLLEIARVTGGRYYGLGVTRGTKKIVLAETAMKQVADAVSSR